MGVENVQYIGKLSGCLLLEKDCFCLDFWINHICIKANHDN